MKTIPPVIKELLAWIFIAPLYAAAIAFGLAVILGFPLMVDLLSESKFASEGITDLAETLYIWLGLAVVAGGYGFFLALAPAALTGLAKVLIDRVVENPEHRERWIYGVAVPISTMAWLYYLIVHPSDFSFTESYWGRPAYSLMGIFLAMGLICCWLMLRRKPTGKHC